MDFCLECLPDIINAIENHPEHIRMKKILYGLTSKVWENDPNVIASVSLYTLLTNLMKTQPSTKRLIMATHSLIKSLNRQEVYVPIAKDFLCIVAPLYNESPDNVGQRIQEILREEKQRESQKRGAYINLIEVVVKEEVYTELQKLPVNIAKFISIAEVASYALNRLPPLYVSSEEGKQFQMSKIEQMRGEIHVAVLQGIGAVMRDPLRKSTPLNLEEVDSFSSAHQILVELEEFVRKIDGFKGKMNMSEMSAKIQAAIQEYNNSLKEVEKILHAYNVGEEKVTAKNLGSTLRKILRKVERDSSSQPEPRRRVAPAAQSSSAQKARLDAQQTSIVEFLQDQDEDNGDETFATSIRDWYSF